MQAGPPWVHLAIYAVLIGVVIAAVVVLISGGIKRKK
jgi:hypothetical protein